MSKHLYVSTDAREAEYVIGYLNPNLFSCYDIDISRGEELAKTFGFNPMSSIEFQDSVPDRTIDSIIAKFVKHQLIAVTKDFKAEKPEVWEEVRRWNQRK